MSRLKSSSGGKRRETSARKSKRVIRAHARSARRALSNTERTRWSLRIEKAVVGMDEYKKAATVLLYASISDEVQTFGLIDRAVADGKVVVLPRMTPAETLTLHRVNSTTELKRSAYDILEPHARAARIAKGQIDLAIVPGVAFDENCYRLGLGKGCYDKLLPKLGNVVTIGLAFEAQLADEIPREAHDRPVSMIITEKRVIRKKE